MGPTPDNDRPGQTDREFQKFIWIRIIFGIFIAIFVIVGTSFLMNFFTSGASETNNTSLVRKLQQPPRTPAQAPAQDHKSVPSESGESTPSKPVQSHESEAVQNTKASAAARAPKITGVEFVEALIKPLDYELNERFWGWRPSGILCGKLKLTDNVNNFQLGVLEATRRATIRLTENISRTGSTASLNPYLEQAMNGFMINADSYMLPSAPSEYNSSLQKLRWYKDQLELKETTFYNRPDNLIPLLDAFEELLGSCDENLVKTKEENGDPVSTFSADNYYYYAKGVASAMATILEAVNADFDKTLDARNGKEVLHHAIEACRHAANLDPWLFVTEANLNGIFANHRANMAAPISHARFYIGLLAKALST